MDKPNNIQPEATEPETETFPQPVPKRGRKRSEQIPQGTYCTKVLAPRKNFVLDSCEWVKRGQDWTYECCVRGEWHPRRKWTDNTGQQQAGKCSRARQAYMLMTPKRENRRCLIGMRRKVIG